MNSGASNSEELITIATITKGRGVKGEVAAFCNTSEPEFYLDLDSVFIRDNGRVESKSVERVRLFKGNFLFKFKGVDSLDEASQLKGLEICLEKESLKPLDEGEFFIHELIGSRVFDPNGIELGEAVDYFENGAHGVVRVQSNEGEFLFPAVPETLLEVDTENGRLKVDLPQGLLEIYQERKA